MNAGTASSRRSCSSRSTVGEVGAERGEAVAVLGLPARHRAVELALGDALRAFDAGAPGQLLEPAERRELGEPGLAAEPAGERSAGVDPGRVDEERAEQPVDVVGHAELGGARVPVDRRDQPLAGRFEHRVPIDAT